MKRTQESSEAPSSPAAPLEPSGDGPAPATVGGTAAPRRVSAQAARLQTALLSGWFFAITAGLWLLKPLRTAALLTHLGSQELPMLRLGSVVVVGMVVLGYSRVVNHLSRLQVSLGASAAFATLILAAWASLAIGGRDVAAQRGFIWLMYCLTDAYAAIIVTLFWTYTNDVVQPGNTDASYSTIGLGGILGGIAGGGITDRLIHWLGPVHLLLACAAFLGLGATCAWANERILAPAPRVVAEPRASRVGEALEGAGTVFRSEYLLLMVGIVVTYETASALTDFVVNVIFERSFHSETELARMYGRLGWIAGGTALLFQLLIVPVLLPARRIALLVPPLVMAVATLSLAALPSVTMAIIMAASDRGINVSLHQVTRETMYVRLGDTERYKAKAFIDIFVDRAAKALASVLLMTVSLLAGTSISVLLALSLLALCFWLRCARALGRLQPQRSSPVPAPAQLARRPG